MSGSKSRLATAACALLLALSMTARAQPPVAAVPPMPDDAALQKKARALFEGLRDDEPAKAMAFFMPRAEFLQVKAIGDPGRYWDQLTAWYAADVHRLHRELPALAGGTFQSFTLSKRVVWTPAGREYNKAAYHSLRDSQLAWTGADGKVHTTVVRVLIDFDGAFWITHLRWPKEGAEPATARRRAR